LDHLHPNRTLPVTCRCNNHRHQGEARCTFERRYGPFRVVCVCAAPARPDLPIDSRDVTAADLEAAAMSILNELAEAIDGIVARPPGTHSTRALLGESPGQEALREARQLVDALPPGPARDPDGLARIIASRPCRAVTPPDEERPPAPQERGAAPAIHYFDDDRMLPWWSTGPYQAQVLCGDLATPFRRTHRATVVTCPRCLEIIHPTKPRTP